MPTITAPDAVWLLELLKLVRDIHEDYPELFSKADEEVLKVSGQLIEEKANERK